MAKRSYESDDFDSPWKEALHHYFRSFLAFFFGDIEVDIDWARGYESLDKEFQRIVRDSATGNLFADKLFKVTHKDGDERWLLIHVEIQGDYDQDLPRRMFDYNCAIWKLYNRTVVSLAVLCDERPAWRPTTFGYGSWGCRMELTFRIAKLLDFAGAVEQLEASDNPFAAVVLAHRQAQQTRRDPESRGRDKLRLVKALYRGNWSKEDVRRLFRLIDWIMTLPAEFEEAFRKEMFHYEKERNMPWLSSIERKGYEEGMQKGIKDGIEKGIEQGIEQGIEKGIEQGIEKGIEQGIEKGIERGIEQGIEKGLRKGLLEGIETALEAKFGRAGGKLMPRVRNLADVGELRQFARFLKTAKSLAEIRQRLE